MDDFSILFDALTRTPLLVVVASPQGPAGLLRESAALYRAIYQMLERGAGYPLMARLRQALTTPFETDKAPARTQAPAASEKDLDDLRRETLDRCRQAGAALSRLAAPDEAAYFKRGLLWVCLQTAQAAADGGGWFGLGAVQVTDDEKEALRQIAFALGLPASQSLVDRLPDVPPPPVPAGLAGVLSAQGWQLARQAPLWAGLVITMAHPSGPVGLTQEMEALPRALSAASLRYPHNRLVAAVVADVAGQYQSLLHALAEDLQAESTQHPAERSQSQQAALVEHALQRLAQTAQALDAFLERTEVDEFKTLLLDLARQVAEAAHDGGVLGLGGRQVSPREQEALRRMAESLKG